MALILDKSITGVTSVDESGNTLTTGYTNLNYKDEFGNIHENPYLVIDEFIINKLEHIVRITVNIYKDLESRHIMKIPIFTTYQNIQADEDLYNKYFSISNMDNNNNVFKAAYDFINNEFYISWKSDEI
jgi:hypothetical protein